MGNKVPTLRFPEFTSAWKQKKISDVFFVNAGGDIEKEHVSQLKTNEFKYPIYANAAENKGFYAYSDIYKIEPPVVTVAGRGVNIGIAHARDHKFYPIVRLLVLKPKEEQDIFFFEYRINTLNIFVESTGVPQLTAPQISNYKVAFPDLPEQIKIANFLNAIDKRVNLLKKKKAELECYKASVMRMIFSQEIRFKDNNGNDFPEWEAKTLGDLGKTYNGLTGKTKEDFGEGKPYIQYLQIFNSSSIDTKDFGKVKIDATENQNRVQYGDVFFTTSSETPHEIGTASVLTVNVDEVYLNSFCFGFRPNSLDEVFPLFAQFFFRSENIRKQIIVLAQGSTRFNMSKVELMKLRFDMPTIKEQEKIAYFLTSVEKSIEKIGLQIKETEKFQQGLLQKMFV